jgi:hypothetical protein
MFDRAALPSNDPEALVALTFRFFLNVRLFVFVDR